MLKLRNLLVVLVCIFSFSLSGNGQEKTTVFAEFLGNGYAWGTLNVDYRLSDEDKGFGIRAGFSFGESADFLGMVNYLVGSGNHKLELGAGILNFSDRDKLALISSDISKGIKPTLNIGYRYHKENGLMLKVGWTPFLIDDSELLLTWLGAGAGWRF